MTDEEHEEELLALVSQLRGAQLLQLLQVARAMATRVEEWVSPETDLVSAAFADEFRLRLQAHHGTQAAHMDRLSFESAFMAASRAAGRATAEAPSRTTRFYDVTVEGERFALKTEGAKSMKRDRLHISKLSEAAWIQDMRSARTRRDRTVALIDELLESVERLVVLRFHRADAVPHYELVEIPLSSFELLRSVGVDAFQADAPRVPLADADGPILELRLDRSDSKITVSKIEKARCIVHADWQLTDLVGEQP